MPGTKKPQEEYTITQKVDSVFAASMAPAVISTNGRNSGYTLQFDSIF